MSTWKPLDDDDPRPVRASLDAIAKQLGASGAGPLEALFAQWSDIVGDAVAAHATPVAVRGGALVVAVDDPAWATELRFLSAQIVERCAAITGSDSVQKIDLRVRR